MQCLNLHATPTASLLKIQECSGTAVSKPPETSPVTSQTAYFLSWPLWTFLSRMGAYSFFISLMETSTWSNSGRYQSPSYFYFCLHLRIEIHHCGRQWREPELSFAVCISVWGWKGETAIQVKFFLPFSPHYDLSHPPLMASWDVLANVMKVSFLGSWISCQLLNHYRT